MKKNNKKIIIILIVMLVLIIGLVAGVVAMTMTGKIALTDNQKLAKGLNDLTTRLQQISIVTTNDLYEKMNTTPFRLDTTTTANIDELKIEGTEQIEQLITEFKDVIGETTIANTLEADWKNNIVNENIKIEMGDVVEQLSVDLKYNKDVVALKSQELNEKYITFNKDGVGENTQYEELSSVFETLEQICAKMKEAKVEVTEEEKIHFTEKYSGIFSKYLTEEIISSEKATINVDGTNKNCSAVSFVLDKKHIQEIAGEYLLAFENDSIGKNIVLNKLKISNDDFNEEALVEIIGDIRNELVQLSDNTQIKISVYCTSFKTYGFVIDIVGEESFNTSLVLGNEAIGVYISNDEQKIADAIIKTNELNIDISDKEIEATVNIKKIEKTNVCTIDIIQPEEDIIIKAEITNEQLSKTESESTDVNTINFDIEVKENKMKFDINTASKLQLVESIQTEEFDNSNSLNLVSASTEDLQGYLGGVLSNLQPMIQTAQENSLIIKTILTSYIQAQNAEQQVVETPIEGTENITAMQ